MVARMSRLLAPTLREAPADAELASHQLMIRAGLIRRVGEAAGLYALLPLGQRVKALVETIIREEMDAVGGQECQMPIVQPAELWQQTGRWDVYGEEMWRLADRHGRRYCLGPTHEEVFTDIVRNNVRSWRQLPLVLYQIQNKYRDERRPRFGMLRAREFVMKDAYSFHRDQQDLEECYRSLHGAYARIFRRCGLECRPVLADSGAIGGSQTHEFMALAEAGEAEIASCTACAWAADVEEAAPALRQPPELTDLEPVATPGAEAVAEVATLLGVSADAVAKILFFVVGGGNAARLVAALIPGDRELNLLKLAAAVGGGPLRPALPEEVPVPLGSAGPVGLEGVPLYTDREVAQGGSWVVGANRGGFHLRGATPGRDFAPGQVVALTTVRRGDRCPECGGELAFGRGIEVGQIFGLGTKYSASLGATFLDEDGQERPMIMGCYGIGVTRTMAAIVEQHHDEDGIIWPVAVAPYRCVLVPVVSGAGAGPALTRAEELAGRLEAAGISTALDDRDERPGVKFKDADLLGYPVRITLGRALEQGQVEVRRRDTREVQLVALADVVGAVQSLLAGLP